MLSPDDADYRAYEDGFAVGDKYSPPCESGLDLAAMDSVRFLVMFYSGTDITDNEVITCDATVSGMRITIRASATWDLPNPDGYNDDSYHQAISCDTPPLSEGTFTVVKGTDEATITVPGSWNSGYIF